MLKLEAPSYEPMQFHVTRWLDNRLVIDIGSYSRATREAGPFTEHTEAWQLDSAGMLIVSMTDRGSGIPSTTKTLMYRKN